MRHFVIPALSLLALAACDSPSPEPSDTEISVEAPKGAAPPAMPGEIPVATPSATSAADEIPLALRGRWGLVPGDCTSTRGDAKGLLEVRATDLKFYESLGTLAEVSETTATRIRGQFDFTGEGMNWQREMTLELGGEDTLVRREYGQEAAPEPFRYARCG